MRRLAVGMALAGAGGPNSRKSASQALDALSRGFGDCSTTYFFV